jgi:hypothetical protein
MKLFAFYTGALFLLLLAGCASPAKTNADGTAVVKEERCLVTGSNLPKRDCLRDVTVLPPSAADTVMPVLPGRNVRP